MPPPSMQIDLTPIAPLEKDEDVGRLNDFDQALEPNVKMLGDAKDDLVLDNKTSLDSYIEQRIAAKMAGVQQELDSMIDNFHLELIR